MAKPTGGRKGKTTGRQMAKVTIRIDPELATRLGVEAVMRKKTMGEVFEEIAGPHLRRWRLPSNVDTPGPAPTESSEGAA